MNSAFHPEAKEEFLAAIDFSTKAFLDLVQSSPLRFKLQSSWLRPFREHGQRFHLKFVVALFEDFHMRCSMPSRMTLP